MNDKKYPSQTLDKFQLRFPSGLRDRIKTVSEENGRSMNTEIIHRLENSFDSEPVSIDEIPSPEDARKLVMKARENMGALAREFALLSIKEAINAGQTLFYLDFRDALDLPDDYDEELLPVILKSTIDDLEAKGYDVVEDEPGDYTVSF